MKIAFFDIDGTLLDVPHGLYTPTDKTVRALEEFQKQGNYVFIATARGNVPGSLNVLHYDGCICCDGHYIEYNGKVLKESIFDQEQIEFVRKTVNDHNGSCQMNGHYGSYIDDLNDEKMIEHILLYDANFVKPEKQDRNIKVQTITAVFSKKEDILQALAKLPEEWSINAYTDDQDIRADIHLGGFSKGSACQYVAETLGCDKSYSFGDGDNDKEMLKLCDVGTAMENASAAVKECADEVTLSVLDDGIAYSFRKYFGIEV